MGTRTPAIDWMGSRAITPTVSSQAARAASRSPQGTKVTSKGVLGKGWRDTSLIALAPAVRPWKAPPKAIARRRPVDARASFRAFSLASEPLFERKTCHSPSGRFVPKACRKAARGACSKRLLKKESSLHWEATASPRTESLPPMAFTQ